MHNNIKQPKIKTNQKVIRDNNVKKCSQGIGRWYWHGGGRQFVCGGQPAAQATVWEVFKKRPADEVYVYL